MNDRIPCIVADSDEFRLEPDTPEEESNLTPLERRLEWLCDEWSDAGHINTYDEWKGVRYAIYGAAQALNFCNDRYEDLEAMRLLGGIVFEHQLSCIQEGKYE